MTQLTIRYLTAFDPRAKTAWVMAELVRRPRQMELEVAVEGQTIAARIRLARDNVGLSQTELAKVLGVNRATVGHWERDGGFAPGRTHLFGLGAALHVGVDWLLGGELLDSLDAAEGLATITTRAAAEQQMLELSRHLPLSFLASLVGLMKRLGSYF